MSKTKSLWLMMGWDGLHKQKRSSAHWHLVSRLTNHTTTLKDYYHKCSILNHWEPNSPSSISKRRTKKWSLTVIHARWWRHSNMASCFQVSQGKRSRLTRRHPTYQSSWIQLHLLEPTKKGVHEALLEKNAIKSCRVQPKYQSSWIFQFHWRIRRSNYKKKTLMDAEQR